MSKKVFLGVGHGYDKVTGKGDPGAVGHGFKEADLTLNVALACRDMLVKHGVSVEMSRTKQELDPLADEIKECNTFNPDLAVDIHINAGGGDGFEVFHYSGGGASKTLAGNIETEVLRIGQNSRGLKTKVDDKGKDYFGFIRQIKAPSVIVECAFIDNQKDLEIIDTPAEQKTFGIAIAKGILKTLGISYKNEIEQVSTSFPTSWNWAIQNSITDGSNPKNPVTREQAVEFLYRFKNLK